MPRIKHGTLVAATVATVTLDRDYDIVEVLNRGDDEIFFRVDKTNPAVDGDDAYVVVSGQWVQVSVPGSAGSTNIRLISAGTPEYTVTGVV